MGRRREKAPLRGQRREDPHLWWGIVIGPTGDRMMNEDEKSRPRDIEAARAGWVRVEREVRPAGRSIVVGNRSTEKGNRLRGTKITLI